MTRSVLVTGAGRGIGLAIARAFQAQGDRVAVTYRTTAPPDDLLALPCDITQGDQVEAMFQQVEEQNGPVDVLVSNAGITRDNVLLRMSEDDFTEVLDTNLTGAFRVARTASKKMIRRRSGRILFVSSASALYGQIGQANYTASKAGLIGFARSLAREFASRGITVNVLSPGLTDTQMVSVLGPEKIAEIAKQIPLARLASPEEIAQAAVFLTSPMAGYITGQVLAVDGGASMGH